MRGLAVGIGKSEVRIGSYCKSGVGGLLTVMCVRSWQSITLFFICSEPGYIYLVYIIYIYIYIYIYTYVPSL